MITESAFKPLWYLKNPHLQTLYANLTHPHPPEVRYDTVSLPDGDSLDLARGTGTGSAAVLILHGLEGSLRSAYAQRLMNLLNQQGIPAVFMYFRGCNGKPNQMLRSYHSGETGDLAHVIHYLKDQGITNLALVGFSLGGNVTLKYLGERQPDSAIRCATAVSVPMLLDDCAARMNRGFSRIYQRELLGRLKRKVELKRPIMAAAGFPHHPHNIRNFVEFDNTYTAPCHGFDNAQHYYRSCSSRQYLRHIDRPTLIIHSRDDPFMTESVIPEAEELSSEVTLELSSHGGHVGFVSGSGLKPQYWLEHRILAFIQPYLVGNQAYRSATKKNSPDMPGCCR